MVEKRRWGILGRPTYLTFLNPMRIQIESAIVLLSAAIHSHTGARTSHGVVGGYRRSSSGQ